MLASLASAAPETRQLGPYTVSLNMNTNSNYQVQIQNPMETPFATSYSMLLMTDNSTFAGVRVINYKNLTDATPDMYKNLIGLSLTLRGLNVTSMDDRVIDGKQGFLATGVPIPGTNAPAGFKYYQASYWLDSVKCECGPVYVGNVDVEIVSTYPQDVTEGILSSVHVAAGQAGAASQTSSGAMPPAEMPPTQTTQQPQQQMPPTTPGY